MLSGLVLCFCCGFGVGECVRLEVCVSLAVKLSKKRKKKLRL